jgi:hypothetical protein
MVGDSSHDACDDVCVYHACFRACNHKDLDTQVVVVVVELAVDKMVVER